MLGNGAEIGTRTRNITVVISGFGKAAAGSATSAVVSHLTREVWVTSTYTFEKVTSVSVAMRGGIYFFNLADLHHK